MNEETLDHLEFWARFGRYLEDNKVDIRLSKPGKSTTSNVVLRRSYFSVRPWRLLKDNQLGVSVQFTGHEWVAQQDRQKVDDRLSLLGMLDWEPGKVSLSRSNIASTSDTWDERYRWLADAIKITCSAFTEIFPPAPQLKLKFHDETFLNSDTGEKYDVIAVAARLPWQPYKRMWKDYPPYVPAHEFVVLGKCDYADWDVLYYTCTKHPKSYRAYFRGYQSPMQYLELGDGYRYWPTRLGVMMLNRCSLHSVEPPRRVDQGARPIKPKEWDAPPWLPQGTGWPKDYLEKHPDLARELGVTVDGQGSKESA